ncbi:MAG: hypothetical protein ACTHK2_07480 [Dokdonella sp.]|uniref:hypothetical protein n=1 Tax=Dokdonella sp. TaxID=2291710 RepID=UPI003F7E5983
MRVLHCSLLCMLVASLMSCAGSPVDPQGGMRIAAKGNKHYEVDGQSLTFVQLESLLSGRRPIRIVVDQSPMMMQDTCVFILGVKLDIPVWARSFNGAIQPVHFNIDSPDITATDNCR